MIRKNNINTLYGPLQIVHDFKFTALNVKDNYSVLDSLGHDEKLAYIKSRIDRLQRLGYGGVVMNVDYTDYLKNPSAFVLFFECAEYAKKLGMHVWIYDEQYYPSGSAGGITLDGHPELEAIGLACITKDIKVDKTVGAIRIPSPCGYSELKYAVAAPILNGEAIHEERIIISDYKDLAGGLCYHAQPGEWRVWCFFIRPLYEHTKFCQGTRASRRYISVFNKKAVERFYKVTFEDGYKAFANGKLSRVVDAVFTDEPYSPFYSKYEKDESSARTQFSSSSIYDPPNTNITIYPFIPWELSLPEMYERKYGHSIEKILPDIFDNTAATKDARVSFYSLLSDMSREAFPEQMARKLKEEGVLLSGHYFGEEGFDYQPIYYGDILEHLGIMGIPGCDSLWSDMDMLKYSTACKIVSSAAHIASRDRVMIEASNMVDKDQNITLQKAKAAISTMFVHGINVITSYYSENLFSEKEMKEFCAHISCLTKIFKGGKYKVNTAMYYPFENLCAFRTPMGIDEGFRYDMDTFGLSQTSATLLKHQVNFDFINKRNLLSSEICDGYIRTPYGERVEYIVFPNIPWIDDDVAEFVSKAHGKGVKIIFDGKKRDIRNILFTKSFICNGALPTSQLSLYEENPHVIVMQQEFDKYCLFMLMNTDVLPHSIKIRIKTDKTNIPTMLNYLTGEETAVEFSVIGDEICLTLDIPALEPLIIKASNI